jgi:thiamine-monophosphate kinase
MDAPPDLDPRLGPGAEFDAIRELLKGEIDRIPHVRVGPGDDALVLEGDPPVVASSDLSVEGIHFRRDWVSLEEAAYRATAAALSDLAAMAAEPLGVLLSLALPAGDRDRLAEIRAGVRGALRAAGTHLLGGDLVASPGPLTMDVTVLGSTPTPLLRSTARPGDELWVTGPLGGCAAAVRAWRAGEPPAPGTREAFVRPPNRIGEAHWLQQAGLLHAGLDLSDGLAGDARHMAVASGVDLVLEAEEIPIHPGADDLDLALRGGEDYELLLAAPAGALQPRVGALRRAFDTTLYRVGRVEAGSGLVFLQSSGGDRTALSAGGFDHLSPAESA